MKKIKILYVHHGAGIGGAPISLLNLILGLDKNKYDPKVLFIHNSVAIELFTKNNINVRIYDKFNTFFIHHTKAKINIFRSYQYIRIFYDWIMIAYFKANKIFQEENPDIVHLNSDTLSSWAFAARKFNCKVVCHNRDPIYNGIIGLRKSLLKYLLNYSVDVIISISKDNAKRIDLPKKTIVVYNFTDMHNLIQANDQSYYSKNVLYLGGIDKSKGFYTVVDALDFLKKDITIFFAGDINVPFEELNYKNCIKFFLKRIIYYNKEKKLKESLTKITNSKNVKIIGLSRDVSSLYKNTAFLISPFTVEHFSRPVIEAFSYKKPAIGTNVEGMDEIIDNNINGLIIEKNNFRALAEAINQLCDNPLIIREMGESGFKKALKLFSPSNSNQVEKIYDALISN